MTHSTATNNSNNNNSKSSEILNESSCSSNENGDHNSLGENGDRLYKCSQCFKTFRKKVHLNQHCRIHSGEKPYGCEYCEKRFTQLSHLWQHRRRHTGERPYKCDYANCSKSFTQLSNLQSHLKTHGDNRSIAALSAAHENINNNNTSNNNTNVNNNGTSIHSFKCNKCHNVYSNKEELQIHISSKHNDNHHHQSNMMNDSNNNNNNNNKSKTSQNKRHFCELCHKRFATEGVISKHIQQSHPQNEAVLVRNLDGSLMIKAINSNNNNINK